VGGLDTGSLGMSASHVVIDIADGAVACFGLFLHMQFNKYDTEIHIIDI